MIYTILLNSIAVYVTARLLPGVKIKNFITAVLVAIGLAVVNALIKPFIVFLTFPLTILTLGLFILVINAVMVMLVDAVMDDFRIDGFGWAVVFGVVLSLVNAVLFWLF